MLTHSPSLPLAIFWSIFFVPLSHALKVKPGAPLVRGNPSIIVKAENSILDGVTVMRRSSEDNIWTTVAAENYEVQALSDNTFRLVDKSVTVSSYAPTEFEYTVNHEQDSGSAWTASCENYDENTDPMQSWVDKVNTNPFHAGSNIYTLALAPTGAANEIVIPQPSASTTYSKQHEFFILSNNQYVAIFSGYGGLLAFTHRSYGMEFQTSLRNPWISPFSARYGCDQNNANCAQPGQWQVVPNISPQGLNNNGELIFEWVINNANVKVIWSLKSFDRPGLHARLELLNGNDPFEFISFPLLIGLGYNQSCNDGSDTGQCDTLYRPGNTSGIAELLNTPRGGTYQTESLMAQFAAITRDDAVLYIGAEDPSGFPKKYVFYPTGKTGGSGIEHYLRDNYQIDAAHAFDVVLRPMCGSWEKAAKMYRQWALTQEWTPAKLAVRTDVSEDLKAGMFWWTHNNGNEANANLTLNLNYLQQTLKPLLRDMDPEGKLRLGVHHYNWHTPEFDHGYPVYTPKCFSGTNCSTADWANYLQQAQQDGQTWVMPYINATNIDVSNMPTDRMSSSCLNNTRDPIYGIWEQEFSGKILSDDMVIQKNGKPSTASYSTLQCLGQMDLNSSTWQSIIGNLASVNFSSGVAAQYLDILGGGYSANYDNVDASYQPGHSNYWKDGTRALADLVKSKGTVSSSTKFTAAEHYSELYLKNVDLFTMYNSELPPTLVPMLPSVYSGYHNVAGMQLRQGDDPQARKYRLSMSFVWGYQLGLTGMNQLVGIDPTSEKPCDVVNHSACDYSSAVYAFNLAKARERMTAILTHGEYMGAILPVSAAGYLTVDNWCRNQGCSIKHSATFPLLQAAYWRDMSGGDVIVITNPTESSQAVDLGLPMSLRGRNLHCLNHEGTPNSCLNSIDPTSISVSLEPMSVVYLAVEAWNDPDSDLIGSDFDNCPTIANPDQTDSDQNDIGDDCEKPQSTTVTIPAPASAVYNSTFVVNANASSGLPVSIAASGACTVSGNTVTMTSGTGSCGLSYTQSGNEEFLPAMTLTNVTQAVKATQTIAIGTPEPPATIDVGGEFQVSAISSTGSDADVYIGQGSTNVCAYSPDTRKVLAFNRGTCRMWFWKMADQNYQGALKGWDTLVQ